MKTFLFASALMASLFVVFPAGAQNLVPDWVDVKHVHERDEFVLMEYVESETQPFVVNHLVQQTPPIPNGPTFPPEHYLYAYADNGTLLWDKAMDGILPLKLLSKEEDRFWMVAYGEDNVQIGNQVLTSAFPYPAYRTYYFVEMDQTGTVLGYFTYSTVFDIYMDIGDAAFDNNGDFILSGTVSRPNLSSSDPPINFSFGNFTSALDWQKRFFYYVARMHKNGTPGGLFDYNAPPDISPKTTPGHIAVNTENGDILFVGRRGDMLQVGPNTYPNSTSHQQLYIGLLDENLNLLSFDAPYVSTYGTIVDEAIYNEVSQTFYLQGSWGDQLSYGVSSPLQGNPHTVNNAYLARLLPNSTQLDTLLPFVSQTNLYQYFISLRDIGVMEGGDMYVSGYVTDTGIKIGNQVCSFNPDGIPDYEGILMKVGPNLALDTIYHPDDHGNSLFNSLVLDNEGSVYCLGMLLNDFSMGNLTANSVGGTLDALLVKFSKTQMGIKEEDFANPGSLVVYPNPVRDKLNLKIPTGFDRAPFDLEIYDLMGRKIWSAAYEANNALIQIDLGGLLAPGNYFVKLNGGDKSVYGRFVRK